MIKSFADDDTEAVFHGHLVLKFPVRLLRPALRKLLMLEAAEEIRDLNLAPGNRLEKLKGKMDGQYSIRINDQWRICFKWRDGNAWDVEIADYH
jgi:toxin HigB-1